MSLLIYPNTAPWADDLSEEELEEWRKDHELNYENVTRWEKEAQERAAQESAAPQSEEESTSLPKTA